VWRHCVLTNILGIVRVCAQHCAGCARSQDMQKQLFISTPPNVLVLHLKRFDMMTETKVLLRMHLERASIICTIISHPLDHEEGGHTAHQLGHFGVHRG
jgi:ubiquitin C-terminal hydrolase